MVGGVCERAVSVGLHSVVFVVVLFSVVLFCVCVFIISFWVCLVLIVANYLVGVYLNVGFCCYFVRNLVALEIGLRLLGWVCFDLVALLSGGVC